MTTLQTFPQFKQHATSLYKILNEEESVIISESTFSKSDYGVRFNSEKLFTQLAIVEGYFISEQKFVDAFVKCVHNLNEKVK